MRWIGDTDPGVVRKSIGFDTFASHSGSLRSFSRQAQPDLGVRGIVAFLLGILIGSVVAMMELNPSFNYHTWLYLSFASGSLGIWVLSAVVIADASGSAREAGVRTFCFLAAVVAMYFLVRQANFHQAQREIIESMSETMNARYSGLARMVFWTPEKVTAFWGSLVAAALAGLDAWGLRKYAGVSPLYWTFAAVPVFLLVFEGWSYFVPMAAYVRIDFVPAAVDVVGALAAAWIVVSMRSEVLRRAYERETAKPEERRSLAQARAKA